MVRCTACATVFRLAVHRNASTTESEPLDNGAHRQDHLYTNKAEGELFRVCAASRFP